MDNDGALVVDNAGGGSDTGDLGGGGEEETLDPGGSGDETTTGDEDPGDGGDRGDEEPASRSTKPTDAGGLRKALREVLAGNEELAKKFPRLEKDVTGALYATEQIRNLGGLRQVSEVLDKVETFGGIEQIEQDREDLEASRELEQGLERGDPNVVAGWAKDFPDGFKRAVLPMYEALEKLDEVAGEQIGSHIFSKIAEKFGLFDGLTELGRLIEGLKQDDPRKGDVVAMFNKLARFASNVKGLGSKAKAGTHDARSQDLDRREQQVSETERAAFHSAVRSEVGSQVTRAMNAALVEKLRGMKINRVEPRTANRLRSNIATEIKRQLDADPSYKREYSRLAASGNRQRAIDYVIRRSSALLPKVIAQVLPDFNLKPSGRAGAQRRFTPNNAGERRSNSSGGGDRFFQGAPKTGDVDFTRTDKSYWLGHKSNGFKVKGQAYLKDGRIAQWGQ